MLDHPLLNLTRLRRQRSLHIAGTVAQPEDRLSDRTFPPSGRYQPGFGLSSVFGMSCHGSTQPFRQALPHRLDRPLVGAAVLAPVLEAFGEVFQFDEDLTHRGARS